MNKVLHAVLYACVLLFAMPVMAGDSTLIRWDISKERINDEELMLTCRAQIPSGVRLYGVASPQNQLLYSGISFDEQLQPFLTGTIEQTGHAGHDSDHHVQDNVLFFIDTLVWKQKFKIASHDSLQIKGSISYLYKKGDEYIPGEKQFVLSVDPEVRKSDAASNSRSLFWIAFIGFISGLAALLTPCVFSMIPVTVSFFIKRSQNKSEGKRNALVYSLSIIGIFTIAGFLITLIWGATALNNLATNWIANLVFFLLFFLFGLSFLGAFNIQLPSSWTNRASSKARANGFTGIFFMALTLVLVSFSCTGPFIGNLIPLIGNGGYFGPLIGFFSFSLALSLPFSVFAFFPGMLNTLAKPGGWMNNVKVTMGFIELALALKFLSNADLARSWRLLDREVFIAIWIMISVLLGLYLLGKIRFHHDDELPRNDFGLPYLGSFRLLMALAAFSFSVYMAPGLWGAPLKSVAAFLPPMGTQDFVQIGGNNKESNAGKSAMAVLKYGEQMHIYEPEVVKKAGLVTYYDYDEALAAARKMKKPLMLDFTGVNCVNCRKMEAQVWSDPAVMTKLREDFVIASLYVDVHQVELPHHQQYFSRQLNKTITSLGDRNADLQISRFAANTQPYYFFLDADERPILAQGYGYDPDISRFSSTLDKVLANYDKTGEQ